MAHYLATLLTTSRVALAAAVIYATGQGRWGLALGLFGLAGLTDALDGPFARLAARGWAAARPAPAPPPLLGAIFDLAADILLVLSLSVALAGRGLIPWLVPVAAGVSFTLYCLACAARRAIVRHRWGGAAGAAAMIYLGLVLVGCQQPSYLPWRSVLPASSPVLWGPLVAILGLASVESLVQLACRARCGPQA